MNPSQLCHYRRYLQEPGELLKEVREIMNKTSCSSPDYSVLLDLADYCRASILARIELNVYRNKYHARRWRN